MCSTTAMPRPTGLEAQTITASNPLTIYQACNLALAGVKTPLVMNLNLDDRLAPDAVEKLSEHLKADDATLAGGRLAHLLQPGRNRRGAPLPVPAARDRLFPWTARPLAPYHRGGLAVAPASVLPSGRPRCGG